MKIPEKIKKLLREGRELGMVSTGSECIPNQTSWAARVLALPQSAQFGIWLAIIFALKAGSIFEPPVWDSAMGVFPPAIYLYETGFDIRGLLQQGNWWQGGPNVHSLSLFTWFLALVITLTQSASATFAIVHVTTFTLVAWSLVLFTRVLADYGLAPRVVLAAAAFVLLMPLVLVQIGHLYTESWVMSLGIVAWARWHEGRPGSAVLFCVLGLAVKLTALAITACIAGVLLLGIRPFTLRKGLLLSALPLAFFVVRRMGGWLGAVSIPGPGWGTPEELTGFLFGRLGMIPDVTLLVLIGMLFGAVAASIFLFRDGGLESLLGLDPHAGSRLICLLMPFVFSAGIVAMSYQQHLFLPRYLVPVIPFALASILILSHEIRRERIAFGILLAGSAFFLMNFDGRLYPPNYGSFSIVERSHAYRNFHRLQIDAIDALSKMPDRLPAFVSREIHYMVSSPLMGYVERDMPQVEPIYMPPYRDLSLERFPEEFILLHTNSGHGGQEITRLIDEANRMPGVGIRIRHFERAGFRAALYWIRKGGFTTAQISPFTDDIREGFEIYK